MKKEKVCPSSRQCVKCPRWLSMCKHIYDNTGQLPIVEWCPIWNGTFNIVTGLWYHQNESDIIKEDLLEIEQKIINFTKLMNDNYNVVCDYVNVNSEKNIISVTFNDYEKIDEILYIHIESRKIDFLIHDDEYIYKILKSHGSEILLTKVYHYLKNKFKKIQLRGGTNNRLYMEMYDLVKLEEHLSSFIESYNKVLAVLDFEFIELSSKRLQKIFGDDV